MAITRYKTAELSKIHSTNTTLPNDAFKKHLSCCYLLQLHEQTSKSFSFFIDFTSFKFQFISPSIKNILGYSPEEILNDNNELFLKHYHPHCALTTKAIHNEAISYINSLRKNNKSRLTISYNVRLKKKDGTYAHLVHRFKLLEFDSDGKTTLLFGTSTIVSDIITSNVQTLTISSQFRNKEKILFKKDFYPEYENGILTKKEIEIYKLIQEGHNSKKIAEILNIKTNTVNTHRKHIIKKLKALK